MSRVFSSVSRQTYMQASEYHVIDKIASCSVLHGRIENIVKGHEGYNRTCLLSL